MKATRILTEEHLVIKKVLQCLEKIVAESERNKKLNLESARTAIDFFTNFADSCHHAKEEDRLFPAMEESGIPREGGPLGVMVMDHIAGREAIQGMVESMDKASQGDAAAVKAFADNAGEYISLLSDHIRKEDHCLFSMADSALDKGAQKALLESFRQVEKEAGGTRHKKYFTVARSLCRHYGIEFADKKELGVIHEEFLS